jgi:hypothetical protein
MAGRFGRKAPALLMAATGLTLAWPSPVHADTALGGYSGLAQAAVVRVQVYDPVIPIPATPQLDAGVGYARSTTDTGPTSRALASYLWPGDVVGDGLDTVLNSPNAHYPVQVNSRFPATATAPASNTAQLTAGNGMTTSTDGFTTVASTTGLGVTDGGTNLLSGIGTGVCQLLKPGRTCPALPAAPVAVPTTIAGLISTGSVQSIAKVVVGEKTVTSTATTSASHVSLLGGLIGLDGLTVQATSQSDGSAATTAGHITIAGVTVAGMKLALDETGVDLTGKAVALPPLPDLLSQVGISLSLQPTTNTIAAAQGSLAATGLAITVDTALVKKALSPITGALAQLVGRLPNGGQIAALLGLGPRIVFRIGDVVTSALAAPAYDGGAFVGGTGTGTVGTTTTGSGGVLGTGAVWPAGPAGSPSTAPGAPQLAGSAPVAYAVPPLGTLPRAVILTGLAIAAVVGWLIRMGAAPFLGGTRRCSFGLATGAPDLRKAYE